MSCSEAENRRVRLAVFNDEARACTSCVPRGLLFADARGRARPLLTRTPSGALGVLLVGEAPNIDDTFDANKGYLTYDSDTDPTGQFMRSLLIDEAGVTPDEIGEIVFTNAVLCLPALKAGKYEVRAPQLASCAPWLKRLIDDANPTIVLTMGAVALGALARVAPHRLKLSAAVGRIHDWYGRKLLPLYHASRLGRLNRSEADQRRDMRALREHLRRG